MDEQAKVGRRVYIYTPGQNGQSLGLGTYLWTNVVLLDTGEKAYPEDDEFKFVEEAPAPQLQITLKSETRLFRSSPSLSKTDTTWPAGVPVTIELKVCGWNHGAYVAGIFHLDGETYAFVMSEVKLPTAFPYRHQTAAH